MKTTLEAFANFIGFAVWADGEYDQAEKETVSEIAESFNLNQLKFNMAVDVAIDRILRMDESEVNAFLEKTAADVDDEEIGPVFEAVMQLIIADGVVTKNEINNMLAIADALGIETDMAVLLFADMIKTEPELEIETSADDED